MFFANSMLVVEVKSVLSEKELKSYSFFEENTNKKHSSRKFYSISFYDENKNIGEIHYTNSFEYGTMNILNFIRKSSYFYLFTSNVQHIKFFKKIINHMINKELLFKILKVDFKNKELPLTELENFEIIKADEIYGIVSVLYFENTSYLIKFYNNGLITFSFTNQETLINTIINISEELLVSND